MSQEEERAKKEDEGEKKDEKEERVPGYCSATCACMNCLKQAIQQKEPPKTSDVFTCNLPPRFDHPHWFNGYGSQVNKEHPLYRTTSSDYGWYPPGIHSVPSIFNCLTQHFTSHLTAHGMYRNYSLNMSAPDPPTKLC